MTRTSTSTRRRRGVVDVGSPAPNVRARCVTHEAHDVAHERQRGEQDAPRGTTAARSARPRQRRPEGGGLIRAERTASQGVLPVLRQHRAGQPRESAIPPRGTPLSRCSRSAPCCGPSWDRSVCRTPPAPVSASTICRPRPPRARPRPPRDPADDEVMDPLPEAEAPPSRRDGGPATTPAAAPRTKCAPRRSHLRLAAVNERCAAGTDRSGDAWRRQLEDSSGGWRAASTAGRAGRTATTADGDRLPSRRPSPTTA
jgi:hypothetical protein